MQIRRLKLTGFKSFVEPTELHIAPGLTGVVGPNGCGKSNLLEAIRWVMGESSPKSMRGGGMDDVIFAGTATRPQRDFAEVLLSVVQAPDERIASVPVDEDGTLDIVRRIERGAGSAYRANGRDVRAKDVALVFADAATGAHSPALVSQGRIAAVIAARPTERRAMLEEAAGIAGLHVRRKDAEQKLRATEGNLARLDDLLAEMDLRAQALRRQARAAERYVSLSERITLGEARTLFARWRDASAAADAADKAARDAEDAVRARQEAQLAAAAIAEQAVGALAEARVAAQGARDAAQAASYRLEQDRSTLAELTRRREELMRQQRQIVADREREGQLAHDAADALERLDEELVAIAARIKVGEAAQPALADRLAEAERAARDADVAQAGAMARQAAEIAERRVAQAAVTSAAQLADRIARDLDRVDAEIAALADPAPITAAIADCDARIAAAAAQRAAAEAALTMAEAARQGAVVARGTAQEDLAVASSAVVAIDAEIAALTKALGAPSAERALDQISVAPGYERALAAALGDDLDAAIGGVGAMRWAGADPSATDAPLPAGTEALIAHVTAPAALHRRLSQVAVADDPAVVTLAVGQRVVTRDGRMRRWDGFIAEDQGAVAAERLVRRNRLIALEADRPAAADAVAAADAALNAATAALRQADGAIAAARAAQGEADTAERGALRSRDEHRASLIRMTDRRRDLDIRRGDLAAEKAKAAEAMQAAERAMAALPDGVETAALLQRLSLACDTARQAVAALNAEQALAGRTLAADRDRQGAVRTDIRNWKARAGDAGRRIADMAAREDEIVRELDDTADKPDALAAAIATLDNEAQQLRVQADEARRAETIVEAAVRGAENDLRIANEALSTARETRAGAQARAENAIARRSELTRLSGERFDCPAPVLPERRGFDPADVGGAEAEQARLDGHVAERERIGPVNLVAATELAELEDIQAKSRADAAELQQAVNQLRGSIGSLNREGRARLLAAFEAVNAHFHRLFTTLFNGGQAHLALVDSDDPLEAGLEIMAQPPGKKLTTLTLLSGGEQALTAVALIFGLFLTNPAPICVLDEVDAPLDDANVERFCDLLDRMVADTATRYLIVTHNAVTMSRMHRLFGVTMVEQGISRLVSVDLSGAERLLAAE